MTELKTKPTDSSVSEFLGTVADQARRKDCQIIVDLLADVTAAPPVMWGSGIIGFGRYRYKYESGREGEWMIAGFSPRKSDLTLYMMPDLDTFPEILKRLGKYKTGKSCLYIKKLSDVNVAVLRELVEKSVASLADKRVNENPKTTS